MGDEASIMPGSFLIELDRLLKDFTNSQLQFGNKIVLISGDFKQTLPVIKLATKTEIIAQCINMQQIFGIFQQRALTQNMRLDQNQEAYQSWLRDLGDGRLPRYHGLHPDLILLPEQFVLQDHIVNNEYGEPSRRPATEQDLIDFVFERPFNIEASYTTGRAIICPLNEDTMNINELIYKQLPGEGRTYISVDSIQGLEDSDDIEIREFPITVIHEQIPSGMPPHILNVKVDSIIILMRNLNIPLGLCNGTRMRVLRLFNNLIEAECIKTGQRAFISRMPLTCDAERLPFKLRRVQFPIRLGYALTGNKAQDQTLDRMGLYLPQPFFAHGQLYVSFSRIKNRENIKLLIKDTPNQGRLTLNHREFFTRNIVY